MYHRDAFRWFRRGGIFSLFLVILISITPPSGFAQANVTLAWSAITNPIVAGYKIYYGGASGVYTNQTTVGNATSLTISNLQNGSTYYFAGSTYSAAGAESSLSTEVSYIVPAAVSPVNQPPTLKVLNNLAINENAGAQSVSLLGIASGATNESQTLTVSAVSSNPTLIPNPTVTYTSPDTTGSLAFSPATDVSGSATITVTVNDGGTSNNVVSQSFIVTVSPVNQPPTLNALNSLTINENAGAQLVSLSGITSGGENQTLTVTAISSNPSLIPNPTVTYTSPNMTGSLAFSPATNTSGLATITVTVNDGGTSNNIVSKAFTVTVNLVDITKPTLAITSPTLNQQWSNGTFTATGKAGDNVAVANVFYSLNGSPWTNATSANNWTNWSATLSLTPGTNSLKAFAVDTSGNASPTNSVSFEYVVPMPLSLQVFGLGVPNPKWGSLNAGYITTSIWIPGYGYYPTTVSLPGYTNGTLLAVNENYTLTAVANPGFAFTNWSDGNGNILTNGPTLRFTMAANLALVANFVDITKPTLAITSPTLNQQWSNGTFTATGKAGDNVAVANVFYSLNGSPWTNATSANNWTNWSATLSLTPGTNSLKAFAVDTSGNASPTNSVTFEYVATIISAAISSSVMPVIASPAILSPANFTPGQFALQVSGTTNAQYVVQASTDLVNWISVQTNKAPFTYVDANAGQFNQRFYRTVSVPVP